MCNCMVNFIHFDSGTTVLVTTTRIFMLIRIMPLRATVLAGSNKITYSKATPMKILCNLVEVFVVLFTNEPPL